MMNFNDNIFTAILFTFPAIQQLLLRALSNIPLKALKMKMKGRHESLGEFLWQTQNISMKKQGELFEAHLLYENNTDM